MKRILSLVLTIMMLVSLAACGPSTEVLPANEPEATATPTSAPTQEPESTPEPTYEDEELARAVELNIGEYRTDNPAVTYPEFFAMLDRAVELIDETRLPEWKEALPEARAATQEINRGNAMCAVFSAAELLGGDYWRYNYADAVHWDAPGPWDTDEWQLDDYWGDTMRFPMGFNGVTEPDGANFGGTAYFYSMGCVSRRSGESLFGFNEAKQSMRCADTLTYEEALRAALRFYEADLKNSERAETELDREILAAADARRQAIVDTPTEVTVGGTSYYVSVSGSDENDGLTPETPWQTLQKVSEAKLSTGDGVFFQRGDIWRGEYLVVQEGVTYSAYGEGAKPAFYGSPENGAGAEKWSLVEGSENIWVYDKELPECGTVVFNDAEAAVKVTPYKANGQYVMPDRSGEPFDFRAALTENLSFYSEDMHFLSSNTVFETKADCKLYLRCDEGNPGQLYESIEFCAWTDGKLGLIVPDKEDAGDEIVLDNIDIKYSGVYGVNAAGAGVTLTVQNCMIGWIGGCVQQYADWEPIRIGNCVGIYHDIDGYSVKNCWLYQAYDAGISNEGDANDYRDYYHHENITYEGNLIEYCTYGIEMFLECEEANKDAFYMKNIRIADNMILHSGYGWGHQRPNKDWDAAIQMHTYPYEFIDVSITGNTLYRSRTALIICWAGNENRPVFSGNTYAQDNLGYLAFYRGVGVDREEYPMYAYDDSAADAVRDILGDTSAVVAPLSYAN